MKMFFYSFLRVVVIVGILGSLSDVSAQTTVVRYRSVTRPMMVSYTPVVGNAAFAAVPAQTYTGFSTTGFSAIPSHSFATGFSAPFATGFSAPFATGFSAPVSSYSSPSTVFSNSFDTSSQAAFDPMPLINLLSQLLIGGGGGGTAPANQVGISQLNTKLDVVSNDLTQIKATLADIQKTITDMKGGGAPAPGTPPTTATVNVSGGKKIQLKEVSPFAADQSVPVAVASEEQIKGVVEQVSAKMKSDITDALTKALNDPAMVKALADAVAKQIPPSTK